VRRKDRERQKQKQPGRRRKNVSILEETRKRKIAEIWDQGREKSCQEERKRLEEKTRKRKIPVGRDMESRRGEILPGRKKPREEKTIKRNRSEGTVNFIRGFLTK
jgi:hypothetical protein